MVVAGVEEQLGLVGRLGKRSSSLEVFVEELVAFLAVHLNRYAGGPRVAELGVGEARAEEQGTAGARTRLRELLRDHHAERDAGVHDLAAERFGGSDAALSERAEPDLAREGHAFFERPERPPI